MRLALVCLVALLVTGCSYLDSIMVQLEAERDAEVRLRHAGLCQSPAASALRRFRDPEERAAFVRLCDRDI